MQVADKLAESRDDKCLSVHADSPADEHLWPKFWALLGGDETQVRASAPVAEETATQERIEAELHALDGSVWRHVKTGSLRKQDIDINVSAIQAALSLLFGVDDTRCATSMFCRHGIYG